MRARAFEIWMGLAQGTNLYRHPEQRLTRVVEYWASGSRSVKHEITDGLIYYWHQPEGDQSLTVAYDRELGRAYFHEATR